MALIDKTIDVPLPAKLEKLVKGPICVPLPKPGNLKLTLFNGGTLKPIVDVTKAIPDDCSMAFSLAMQLAPVLVSVECLIKVLKLIKPLIDVVNSVSPPDPIKLPKAIYEFGIAAGELLPCLAIPTPLMMIPFVRDILLLIIRMLHCITSNLKSILAIMNGLTLQIFSAQQEGNTELMAALQCAQDNANASAQHMMSAIDPILVLLSLVEPFLGIAGVDPIKTPTFASADSIEGLQNFVNTLDELTKVLQLIVDNPPLA
jgi:hypothetical protein